MRSYWSDFVSLWYPRRCLLSGEALAPGEYLVSTAARLGLPRAHYDNPDHLKQEIISDLPLQQVFAFYRFTKGNLTQQLLQQIKYRGQKALAQESGKWMGSWLLENQSRLELPDLLIPVPLHWRKKRKRGYNQAEEITRGFSQSTGIPWRNDILKRVKPSATQTRKNRLERWENVKDIFECAHTEAVHALHLGLIDDVFTTGATAEAALCTLMKGKPDRLSIFTLAEATLQA